MYKLKLIGIALGVLTVAAVVAACGGGGSSTSDGGETAGGTNEAGTVQVALGTKTGTLPKTGANIALFMIAETNEWQEEAVKGVKEAAEEDGNTVEVYSANEDANEQLNEIQNATQKGMDAAIIQATDGNLLCNAATKELSAKGIPVVVLGLPLCNPPLEADGEEQYADGTLSYVGGNNIYKYVSTWLEGARKLNPGPRTVAFVGGPALVGQTVLIKAAIEQLETEHPEFEVKYYVETNFTTPDTLAKTQTLLKAHPDVEVILEPYSPDLARGVVEALEAEGLAGKVSVIDEGASKYAYEQLEKGTIQMTAPLYPYTLGAKSAKAIKEAQEGKKVPHFISESEKGNAEEPILLTKENMGEFEPQY